MKNDTNNIVPTSEDDREFKEADTLQDADNDEVAEISKRLLKRNAAVYEELAK